MVPRLEPSFQVEPGWVGSVGAREAAGDEAQPFGFRPYCFLKALPFMHGAPVHGPRRFS
jgi:hypothetical protein